MQSEQCLIAPGPVPLQEMVGRGIDNHETGAGNTAPVMQKNGTDPEMNLPPLQIVGPEGIDNPANQQHHSYKERVLIGYLVAHRLHQIT